MAATETPVCDFGWLAPDFALPGIDGKTWSLADAQGEKGTMVVFICNHCPFVKAIIERLVHDADELRAYGVNTVAINSNDVTAYPEDSFDNMKLFAAERGITFPYLFDESQAVARAYGAVCTPDFFGFNGALELQYRGRLDASRREPVAGAPREMFHAMVRVAETGHGPADQIPSIGCSIKWRDNA